MMSELSQQIIFFILSWAIWFTIFYLFAYLFKGKMKIMGARERMIMVGKASLLITSASVVINVILGIYYTV